MPRTRHVTQALRRRLIYSAVLSTFASTSVFSQDSETLDCSNELSVLGVAYNLNSLAGERAVNRTRPSPPTTIEDELRFNLCQDLSQRGVADGEQCPTGTRACLTKTIKKSGESDRLFAVIPVAQTSLLKPSYSTLQSPGGLSIQLHGPSWPPDSLLNVPQSLNVTLLCIQDGASDPTFASYEGGVVSVEWKTTAGCPAKRDDGSDGGGSGNGDKETEKGRSTGGSGIGWFFLLLFISFLGYFVLGAYYNYNNFGATGWDLVPHRDFWRDVPYLLRDFGEHLCSTLRPGQGGTRRGYMAV